jgi:hypothetical protein
LINWARIVCNQPAIISRSPPYVSMPSHEQESPVL